MSNNQFNLDPNSNYGASLPTMGTQPQTTNNQELHEGMPSTSTNQNPSLIRNEGDNSYNMGQQNAANSYNQNYMGQNQSTPQPGYSQAPLQHNNSNFSQERPPIGESSSAQHPSMSSTMIAQPNLSSNQPSIGQRSYQSFQQPGFGGNQPSSQNISQNIGGMNSSSGMNQSYMQNNQSQMPSMPPVGVNPMPSTFNASQGEKTYEPPSLSQNNSSSLNLVELIGISPESQREFEEKSARCKTYSQTDIFAAIQVKNEDDGLKIIEYLINKKGVSLTAIDKLEQTALFYAARDGKIKILKMLIDSG